MAILFGGIDPMKLIEGVLNLLIQKGMISVSEAQTILDSAKAQK